MVLKIEPPIKEPMVQPIGMFRRIAPQILMTSILCVMGCNFAMVQVFPSIVVPSLLGIDQHANANEKLRMSAAEVSWLSSIAYIAQPVGSILAGCLVEKFGRKKITILCNIPHIIVWLLLSYTNSPIILYVAFTLLGLGDGLMMVPFLLYLPEISEVSMRGILLTAGGFSMTIGILVTFVLGLFLSWRQAAFVCSFLPSFAFFALFFLPESPFWYLLKNRPEDSLKSLQWLRGWVKSDLVLNELNDLQRHVDFSKSCNKCKKSAIKCEHPPSTFWENLIDIRRKRTLKPAILLVILFVLLQFSGMIAMRPYIIPILRAYGIPLDANFTTILLGSLGILACFCLLVTIRWTGKRKAFLLSIFGTFFTFLALSIYGFIFFPSGWSSFDPNINPEHLNEIVGKWSYFALAMFLIHYMFFYYAVFSVPSYLLIEILPLETKHFYCPVIAIFSQILIFISTKIYYDIEVWLSLPGAIGFYGGIAFIGFVVTFFILPETENRSLEDIELHFSNDKISLWHIHIRVNAHNSNTTK